MSRNGSSGSSLGICSARSGSAGSNATEISSLMLSAISYVLFDLFNRYLEFRSAPVFYFGQQNQQYAILQFGRRSFDADSPAQWHHAAESSIISLGTEVRNNFLSRVLFLLLAIDVDLFAGERDFDLIRGHAGEFEAHANCVLA